MKKLFTLFLSLVMTFTLVSCGSSEQGYSFDGENFIYSSELDVKNLDSTDADDGMSFTALHACVDGLMGTNEQNVVTYALAEKSEVSSDGLTRTYTLKDGLTWSNGDPVTANDFVYAAQRIFKNQGNYYYLYTSDGAHIKGADELANKLADGQDLSTADLNSLGVKALDDKTIEYSLTIPVAYFDEFLAFPSFYPVNQKFAESCGDLYGKKAENVLSCGPFVIKTWDIGKQVTYVKNENYWNKDAVTLKTLTLNLVVSPEVASTSFENHETDFAFINSSLVDAWKDNEAFNNINDGYLFYISVNFNNPDLQNLNVRKALSLAINRQDLCENSLKDGSTAAAGFVPVNLARNVDGTDYRDLQKPYDNLQYDLQAAQEALDAGLKELGKDSISIELLYGTDESPMDTFATYLQSAYSQLNGLNVSLVATTKQDRIYNRQKNGNYDICVTRWGPDYADPTTYLTLLMTGNSNNYGKFVNTKYDELMNKVSVDTNETDRWNHMVEAEQVLISNLGCIPVFEKGSAALINPAVTGVLVRSVGVPYKFNFVKAK